MPEMQVFENSDFGNLSVIYENGKAYFPATECAKVLGYSNPHDAISRHCRSLVKREVPHPQSPSKTIEANFIPEGDLYRLITHSKMPTAERFERWVFDEVLPSVRQTGSYSVQPMTPAQLLAAQAQVLVDMEARMAQMETQAHALESKVDTAIKVFSRPSVDHWKEDMDKAIKELCAENGLSVLKTKGALYEELERAVNCNVDRRLGSLRARSRKAGKRYKDAMALTKLDAIAADKSLRAVFEGIVRSWQSKYAVSAHSGEDPA